jgi:hypothetical protein
MQDLAGAGAGKDQGGQVVSQAGVLLANGSSSRRERVRVGHTVRVRVTWKREKS